MRDLWCGWARLRTPASRWCHTRRDKFNHRNRPVNKVPCSYSSISTRLCPLFVSLCNGVETDLTMMQRLKGQQPCCGVVTHIEIGGKAKERKANLDITLFGPSAASCCMGVFAFRINFTNTRWRRCGHPYQMNTMNSLSKKSKSEEIEFFVSRLKLEALTWYQCASNDVGALNPP